MMRLRSTSRSTTATSPCGPIRARGVTPSASQRIWLIGGLTGAQVR
ncbi:hypothetical protein I552_7327 [Mycobacterium xenopi 3993]|nr:hypothetical protein I552_7327 [Mycobacterium xenopi 3993]